MYIGVCLYEFMWTACMEEPPETRRNHNRQLVMWVLRTELMSSARAPSTLNHWAMPIAPKPRLSIHFSSLMDCLSHSPGVRCSKDRAFVWLVHCYTFSCKTCVSLHPSNGYLLRAMAELQIPQRASVFDSPPTMLTRLSHPFPAASGLWEGLKPTPAAAPSAPDPLLSNFASEFKQPLSDSR